MESRAQHVRLDEQFRRFNANRAYGFLMLNLALSQLEKNVFLKDALQTHFL